MKIVEGVDLHVLASRQFKTNHIKIRFSGQKQEATIARRVLVAQMLETATEHYPSSKQLREKLADMYGTSLSTSVSSKAYLHCVDIDISFINDKFLSKGESLLDQVLDLIEEVLYHPLISVERYQTKVFDVEKQNLINALEADKEDHFYAADLALQRLYYQDETIAISKYSRADLVEKEDAFTAYQEFQSLLANDKIDIFVLGDVDDYKLLQRLHKLPFEDRYQYLSPAYSQEKTNLILGKIDLQDANQSILELGYHLPISYEDSDYAALLVFNGLLGGFAHSKLFRYVREEAALAYTISSRYDIFSNFFKIYAGVNKKDRDKALSLINKQLRDMKLGRFSDREVRETKQMLLSSIRLSEDNPQSLIENAYYRTVFGSSYRDLDRLLTELDEVDKKAVMSVARKLSLQAVYFMEGD
ncbi:EF-P 5-aminopentanol modification-associated protein YfmF [Streptococcus loxodontisalivarius]|uniref:Zn-dependent peptidase n=1 Tax=Streptococcus loxodontisalivarius TaxID=1349415 RepID=A0ABS2PQS8_9STRE|nr:pitrilysin family protein [Streptococcus loxodontisalivarius]MBM7641895.1 putative Zn-dependent peptidase [Streptococcus loxodontisalivarius]